MKLPPQNALRVSKWADLPQAREPARYEIQDQGQTRQINLKDGNRQVMDGLLKGPIYCASPVRLSDRVLILRRDYGVKIDSNLFKGKNAANLRRFGIYTAPPNIKRVSP